MRQTPKKFTRALAASIRRPTAVWRAATAFPRGLPAALTGRVQSRQRLRVSVSFCSARSGRILVVRNTTHEAVGAAVTLGYLAAVDSGRLAAAAAVRASLLGSCLPDADQSGTRIHRRIRLERRSLIVWLAGAALHRPIRPWLDRRNTAARRTRCSAPQPRRSSLPARQARCGHRSFCPSQSGSAAATAPICPPTHARRAARHCSAPSVLAACIC